MLVKAGTISMKSVTSEIARAFFYPEKPASKDAGPCFYPSGIFICYTADFLIDDGNKD